MDITVCLLSKHEPTSHYTSAWREQPIQRSSAKWLDEPQQAGRFSRWRNPVLRRAISCLPEACISAFEGDFEWRATTSPRIFSPSSYWSSDEKDLFFHGLAVYSRSRPDLIAESIKIKTILDVCLYLDVPQTASSPIPSETHGSFRSSIEPAMEVFSRGIKNEEQIAAALAQLDSCTRRGWKPWESLTRLDFNVSF